MNYEYWKNAGHLLVWQLSVVNVIILPLISSVVTRQFKDRSGLQSYPTLRSQFTSFLTAAHFSSVAYQFATPRCTHPQTRIHPQTHFFQVQIGLSWNYNAITPGEVDAELTPEVVAAQGAIDDIVPTNGRGLLQDRSSSVRVSM